MLIKDTDRGARTDAISHRDAKTHTQTRTHRHTHRLTYKMLIFGDPQNLIFQGIQSE